ncbi:hypothetical protein BB8028_0004g13020 [Beauveria bassiana]|uniref:Peptidase S1 domain-containing protein n=1 Tax=Beauveria bassiana TaxID=176275 RepID=A0A2S7YER7_BEABA|nr:hypothetical protein BB8028_0004g13020 [Beauveria bassiana]
MVRKASITLVVAFSAALAAAAAIDKRIRGGEEAQEGEFPFVVRLHYENPIALCAGSLLDSTTVLTAAHCLEGKGDEVLSVRAGSLSKDYGGVVAEVESVRQHPDWTQIDHQNDIAILKLSSPIEESETIGYAKLPPGGSNLVNGSTAVAAGWGDNGCGPADRLRKVGQHIRDITDCVKVLPTLFPDGKVCASGAGDTAAGDSGGPLIDEATGQVIGITSFWHFYTKVSSYRAFINGIDPRAITA